jgi:hypothetical protein
VVSGETDVDAVCVIEVVAAADVDADAADPIAMTDNIGIAAAITLKRIFILHYPFLSWGFEAWPGCCRTDAPASAGRRCHVNHSLTMRTIWLTHKTLPVDKPCGNLSTLAGEQFAAGTLKVTADTRRIHSQGFAPQAARPHNRSDHRIGPGRVAGSSSEHCEYFDEPFRGQGIAERGRKRARTSASRSWPGGSRRISVPA